MRGERVLNWFCRELGLKAPIYSKTAANGHFGHSEFPWEKPKDLKIPPHLAARLKKGVQLHGAGDQNGKVNGVKR